VPQATLDACSELCRRDATQTSLVIRNHWRDWQFALRNESVRAMVVINHWNMKQHIRCLRNRAEEARTARQDMHDPEARRSLFRIAESYENMATHLEIAGSAWRWPGRTDRD
jgi:hypothetical protein